MLDSLIKYDRSSSAVKKFSILIPTWNNLEYLQSCIRSIIKHSNFSHQIIVIVNEGNDKTIEWLETQQEIDYIHSKTNIGICYGLNIARSLIKSEYVVYMNDDMYVLPEWDKVLYEEIQNIQTKLFMLSGTLIEPSSTNNPCVVVRDYGNDLKSFKKELLLSEYKSLSINDWSGSMWPPNLMHIDTWDLVGEMSTEFSPGMYSDPDLAFKLYEAGVRIFKGKGSSLIYHFGSKSTRRLKKNRGRKLFLLKWGITANVFKKKYLKLGEAYSLLPDQVNLTFQERILNKMKRAWYSLKN